MCRYGTILTCVMLFSLCTLDLFSVSAEGAVKEDPSKYIVIDGIKVLRADYEAFARAEEKIKNQKVGGGADGVGEASDLQREYNLEQKEDVAYADRLPKRCHVCKIFAEEFIDILKKNFTDSDRKFEIEESELNEVLEEACDNMEKYAVTRISKFRYKRGNSIIREVFNEAQKDSKIKTWSYTMSKEQIDDPTGEISRLKQKCTKLIGFHGKKNILRWAQEYQHKDFTDWFCKQIYLKRNKKGCLIAKIKKIDVVQRDEL